MILIIDTRHELARWLWIARKQPINRLEVEENLRDLVALCPDSIIDNANALMHAVKNQLTKLHGRAQFFARGMDPEIRIGAIKVSRAMLRTFATI